MKFFLWHIPNLVKEGFDRENKMRWQILEMYISCPNLRWWLLVEDYYHCSNVFNFIFTFFSESFTTFRWRNMQGRPSVKVLRAILNSGSTRIPSCTGSSTFTTIETTTLRWIEIFKLVWCLVFVRIHFFLLHFMSLSFLFSFFSTFNFINSTHYFKKSPQFLIWRTTIVCMYVSGIKSLQ